MSGRVVLIGKDHTCTLPSGYRVKARRPSTFTLVASGGFPAELASVVWQAFGDGGSVKNLFADPTTLSRYSGMIESYLPHVLVGPTLVVGKDKPSTLTEDDDGLLHGEMNLADVSDFDKQWLILFGMGMNESDDERGQREERTKKGTAEGGTAADLATFRDESARPDAGQPSEEVRTETVVAGGSAE